MLQFNMTVDNGRKFILKSKFLDGCSLDMSWIGLFCFCFVLFSFFGWSNDVVMHPYLSLVI